MVVHRSFFLYLIAFVLLTLSHCSPPSEIVNGGGGSETWGMHGKLVDLSSVKIEGAVVSLYQRDSTNKSTAISTDTTDTAGVYHFDTTFFAVGRTYNIAASYDDGALVAFIDSVVYVAKKTDLGTDTLKAPGSIAGSVISSDTTNIGTVCFIPGTSYSAYTNETGGFIISNVPEGVYRLYFNRPNYIPAIESLVVVTSGKQTIIPQRELAFDPSLAPPTPKGVTATYDSLTGAVTLLWQRVDVLDLDYYVVYIKSETVSDSFPVFDTVFVDTVRIYTDDTIKHPLTYKIRAFDYDGNASLYSNMDTAWVYARQGPDTWTTTDSLRVARHSLCAATIGENIYAIGGAIKVVAINGLADLPQGTVEVFNTRTRRWKSAPSLKVARYKAAAVTCDKRIYVFGGYNRQGMYTKAVEMFDTATQTWDSIAAMPFGCVGHAVACVDKYIYLIGGDTNTISKQAADPIRSIRRFNTDSRQWSTMASLQTPRFQHQAVVSNGHIFIIGGYFSSIDTLYFYQDIEQFDPAANTVYSSGFVLAPGRYNFQAVSSGTHAFIFGGAGSLNSYSTILMSVQRLDMASGEWQMAREMPSRRQAMGSAFCNGKIYLIGGSSGISENASYKDVTSKVEVYNP